MQILQNAAQFGPLQRVKVGFDRVWDWSCYQATLGFFWLYVLLLVFFSELLPLFALLACVVYLLRRLLWGVSCR